jgi:anaerobic ribonucleoside-triphosphate reductase
LRFLENQGYDEGFVDFYNDFAATENGMELLKLEGISPDKIAAPIMSQKYFGERLADMSIDQNANANESISPNNYQSEVTKGNLKLVGYHLLWQKAVVKYGMEKANKFLSKIWTKTYYFHDASAHGIQTVYCLAFSTYSIMMEGRKYGQLQSLTPKRADSFMAQVIEAIMDISNTIMGAVAPADMLVNYAYLSEKDRNELAELIEEWESDTGNKLLFVKLIEHDYHVDDAITILTDYETSAKEKANKLMKHKIVNDIQKMVHIVNNKYRTSGQSPFTNVSIFCPNSLKALFGELVFPDGSGINYEYTMYVQKLFGEFIAAGDPATGLPYRFPVATVNMNKGADGKVDEEFLDWVSEQNYETGSFNIYTSEGSKIAMCPLHGKEEVVVKNEYGIIKTAIEDLNDGMHKVLCDGEFVDGKFTKHNTESWRILALDNGLSYVTTPEHLNVTQRGNVPSVDVKRGDKIRLSNKSIGGVSSADYKTGYFVGLLLGNNYYDDGKPTIVIKSKETAKNIMSFCEERNIKYRYTLNRKAIKFFSKEAEIISEKYIHGQARRLGMNASLFSEGDEFRSGVLDGYLSCDKDGIYTSSERMVSDLKFLISSLGKTYSYEPLGAKPLYHFTVDNEPRQWAEVVSNKIYYTANKNAYCFNMNSDDHLFQMANGVITHNCRFQNDLQQMREYKIDTFGNGGINIGSARVITLNLPRIALRAKGDEREFFKILEEEANGIRDLMVLHRELLKERVEQGFVQFIKPLGWVSLDRLFATIGEHGIYEANWFMGYDITNPDGIAFTTKVLKKLDELTSKYTDETGIVFNVEEIPAESAAVALAKADVMMFGEEAQPFEMYSNQFVPNISDANVFEKLELSGKFLEMLPGGGIAHINVDEQIKDPAMMKKLILMAIEYGVPHFAINYGFGICENGHTSIVGNGTVCPICGGKIDDWLTRIIGYFVKVSSWNKVRRDWEFERRNYKQLKEMED